MKKGNKILQTGEQNSIKSFSRRKFELLNSPIPQLLPEKDGYKSYTGREKNWSRKWRVVKQNQNQNRI